MNAVRTVLLVLVCAAAIAGTVIFFGSDGRPYEEKDRFVVGSWKKGDLALELAEVGRYALVVGTSGAPAECGKWRLVAGSLQMRAKKSAPVASTLLMTQPGFRAGTVEHHPATSGSPEELTLTLLTAKPGTTAAVRWNLARTEEPLLQRCD